MSESQYNDLHTSPHGNMNDDLDLQPEESNTCCICADLDNSLDETDPDLTQLLLECLGLDHDNRVNTPEKVGEFGICFNCKVLLEEWKFSRDQETKFRTRVRQLKATLTAKILESSGKDSSWLPRSRGKSWSQKLREIVSLNNDPIVQVKKYRRARDDEPYSNQVSSWHNNVHVAGSYSSSLQNAVNKEIPAIPTSSVQTQNPRLKTSRKKTLSQRNIDLTSRGSCDSGGVNQASASMLIPNAESIQGPCQSTLMAPALMMKNSCQTAGSGLRPIMNTTAKFIGSSYPPQPYAIRPSVPTFQVSSNNNFATGKIICCSSPSYVPSGVVENTFVPHPYAPNQPAQAPCDLMPKEPALFPVQDSSYQSPPSFQPVSSFPIMPTIGPSLFRVVANGPGGKLFLANSSGGQVAVANAPARSQTSHTKFRPIPPNPHNLHMVASSSLNSGGQATEHMQTHRKTGTAASMPIYPLNMTAHLQQIVAAVNADASSSSQASNNGNTEKTTHTAAPTNALVIKKKRKESSGTSTRVPTKKASIQQIIPQTDQSHIYYNIRLDYLDGKYICGQCNRYFEGPHARTNSRRHVRKLHIGYPWQSQPVQDLGDDNNYMYGNKIPFRKYREYFICGACETLISGKKPDSLIIQHILEVHPDLLLNDTTQDAVGYEDGNRDLMGQIKAEVDWETWTDESSSNFDDYAEQAQSPALTQDPIAQSSSA